MLYPCFWLSVPMQSIAWKDRLQNDPLCVQWYIKSYSLTHRTDVLQCILQPASASAAQKCRLLHDVNSHTLCLKKVPTFKLSVTLSNVNQFMKFAIKPTQRYPPYLRHVAVLLSEINNALFLQICYTYGRKCKQIIFLSPPLPLLFIHKFRYFQCLK